MAPVADTPRRPASTRVRVSARPKPTFVAPLSDRATPTNISSEPPRKRRKYVPGGPGGGGRFVDDEGNELPVGGTGPGGYNYIGSRGRVGRDNAARGVIPETYPRRERASRPTRTVAPRSEHPQMRFTSAAQAAAVVQSDGFKPREERAWEEFHPEMDIEAPLRAFSTYDLEGIQDARPTTPNALHITDESVNGGTPNGLEGFKDKSDGVPTPAASINGDLLMTISIPGTPGGGKRRPGRPPKDPIAFFTARAAKLGKGLNLGNLNVTPKAPRSLPLISNINAKEKLTLPQPSYRKTDTLARFEDRSLGLVRYVDKSMANVGYQESDIFTRPERVLIKAFDANADDDLDINPGYQSDGGTVAAMVSGGVGRVEYDMDEQDDKWLEEYNKQRKHIDFEPITREVFEITMTKVEKEWHLLEKRIPKPNPKPPQTQRPRSSSAAAVNGEPQLNEEQDSKCAICDDGDCENTNAIVFCDGCDSAVHQECYGVPFIPEGQWLCRKCQLIGRGVPTCIFCPNTDGAFKQTNASKWAHLLCAMWIPEVSLGNHTFMEPVMDAERVPKNRWKLLCYICDQKMGACIQCSDKHCYEAFHATCARRAGLYLRMKNDHGTLAFLDGTTEMEARCHKHVPPEHEQEHNTAQATKDAKQFYKKTMKGRLWANSQASATAMAASHRHAFTEHQPDESQLTGAKISLTFNENKKKGNQPQKQVWKLPSGAPVIPQIVFNSVEKSLQRFNIHKRKEYSADACRYWTLKREARRGAALLKRLQLQMETFSSMEITRRNWAGMGSAGRPRLARRIEFAQALIGDLEKLKSLADDVLAREHEKVRAVELEEDLVDTVYFPIAKHFPPVIDKSLSLDIRTAFRGGLIDLQKKVEQREFTTSTAFVREFSNIVQAGITTDLTLTSSIIDHRDSEKSSPAKKTGVDLKERKRLAKRILKAVQPQLEAAARAESDITGKAFDELLQDIERMLESCLESKGAPSVADTTSVTHMDAEHDREIDLSDELPILVKDATGAGTAEDMAEAQSHDFMDVDVTPTAVLAEEVSEDTVRAGTAFATQAESSVGSPLSALLEFDDDMSPSKPKQVNGVANDDTPPETNGYIPASTKEHPTPPTPPVSTSETNDAVDVLTHGGVPWYLKQFDPVGTSVVQSTSSINDTKEVDVISQEVDEMVEEDGDIGSTIAVSTPATKKVKARPKKKARSRR